MSKEFKFDKECKIIDPKEEKKEEKEEEEPNSIEICLKRQKQDVTLEKDNAFKCDNCDKLVKATK